MNYTVPKSHPKHAATRKVENVLVLQGGGSLGAFSCGVYKALAEENIKIDIVAGTSIGGINAAIIAGSKKDNNTPEKSLEEFWYELSDSSYEIIPETSAFVYDSSKRAYDYERIPSAANNAALFGVPKMFIPRWDFSNIFKDRDYFNPATWTYIYDHSPLRKTLDKYVDYDKLFLNKDINKSNNDIKRLILTAVNVLTAEPITFDSWKMQIKPNHLLATSAYPIYGFPSVEVDKGVYAWDGSLLSNTPVREVIAASPRNDKHIFIVENYPRVIDRLPSNMVEVLDRAKDIIFSDKTKHNIKMTKLVTRQIQLIEQLYDFYEQSDKQGVDPYQSKQIEKEYNELVNNYGAEIHTVMRITRNRIETPNVSKNANFSKKAIKDLIHQGRTKMLDVIKNFKEHTRSDQLRVKS
ncbi:patatin-like phospholipase family protein [Candidatus Nitrosocosmicus hydrocola]|uniref:patatin-like phospholipase family protein n=1 Tax=Candidatus Nitrosocosmicus hydrocola TaxID=1826872 RepID=UPI0011E602DE|nr:patatin-like phospholipase family protein [Candidatus Nitrosocosmicus hydrocola]